MLSGREDINWVTYPGLKSHKDYTLATKLLPRGPGAILSFGIKKVEKSQLLNLLKI